MVQWRNVTIRVRWKNPQPLTRSHKITFHFTSARLHLHDTLDQNISCILYIPPGNISKEKSYAESHTVLYTGWKEDNLSHGCFPMSLFKNAGRLGDSGWSQTLPSTDLTQDTSHQLSSLLFHALKYSCSHEINWLIIIIPQVNLQTLQHSQLLGLLANTWHCLCGCITTSKCYTWIISFIQTLDPVQLAMVAAAAPALLVKQINDKICDTKKKESLNISLPQCVLRDW